MGPGEAADGKGGIFRSNDKGATWERRNEFDQGAMYYAQVIADPKNVDRIFVMNVTMRESLDGGKTLHKVEETNHHGDNHAIWIDPDNTKHWLLGSDGGVAETYDVIVQPHEEKAYTIFAQPESRGSYARGTLAPRMGVTAAIPPMDPFPLRTMADMGMGGMAQMKGMKMSGMSSDQMPGMKDMQMSGTSQNSMPEMKDMDMSGMRDGALDPLAGKTPFPQPGLRTTQLMSPPSQMMSRLAQTREGEVPLHLGPEVASVPMSTSPRLHDPGDGLNGNGRRVLTYADLHALYKGVDGRPPTREIILHLTGNMVRFIWGFDAYKFSQAEPIHLKLGERVRFVLINDTMMEHPIHLHGLWSELENGSGEFSPYKHTLLVKPAERVSYLISADTPGRWAFHCHLLYHMAAGMFPHQRFRLVGVGLSNFYDPEDASPQSALFA